MARNGYVWWYVDALSDDGRHGLTIIAFIGSVFSPYYAHARRRAGAEGGQGADPLNHCSLNVSLYTIDKTAHEKRWTMTERGRGSVYRNATTLQIGPSSLRWEHDTLFIEIDEVTVPWPSRVRGKIVLRAPAVGQTTFNLDDAGAHHWRPLAPTARIEVELDKPAWHWQGSAYLDTNAGNSALEDAFIGWQWCRASLADGSTVVLYDGTRRDGSTFQLGKKFDRHGAMTAFEVPPRSVLPASSWRIARSAFGDRDAPPAIIETMEDGPFYARSLLRMRLQGEQAIAFHETLSLDRFRARWVQALLPFRMPRR